MDKQKRWTNNKHRHFLKRITSRRKGKREITYGIDKKGEIWMSTSGGYKKMQDNHIPRKELAQLFTEDILKQIPEWNFKEEDMT